MDYWFNIRSEPENVFKNECDNFQSQNYFLLPNGMSNAGFVVDRNCHKPFNKVIMKNTNNGQNHFRWGKQAQEWRLKTEVKIRIPCRGTDKFQIQTMSESGGWETILENELQNAYGLGCNVPLDMFHLELPQYSRFVRFLVKTLHGDGAGLQYLGLEYDGNITISARKSIFMCCTVNLIILYARPTPDLIWDSVLFRKWLCKSIRG